MPYSHDPAPCDFYLLPILKIWLAGQRFESCEDVKASTDAYFAGLEKEYFLKEIDKFKNCCIKCIKRKEVIIEK